MGGWFNDVFEKVREANRNAAANNPKEVSAVANALTPKKALQKENLPVKNETANQPVESKNISKEVIPATPRKNALENALRTPEERAEYEREYKSQKLDQASIRDEKNPVMRKKMVDFALKEGVLTKEQIDAALKERAEIDELLVELYNELGNQRKLADFLIREKNASEEEVEGTILRSVSDYVVQEFIILDRNAATQLLEWFGKEGLLKYKDNYIKAKTELDKSIKKWPNLQETAKSSAKAMREERLQKSKSFRIQKISFSINKAKKILNSLRTGKREGIPLSKSTGLCATAVSNIFFDEIGIRVLGDGWQWAGSIEMFIKNKLVAYKKVFDEENKTKAKNGSVLVWNKLTGERLKAYQKGDTSKQSYGHVAIVIDGQEVSDYITPRAGQRGDPPDHVFVPIE